jgi:hypothetical protein
MTMKKVTSGPNEAKGGASPSLLIDARIVALCDSQGSGPASHQRGDAEMADLPLAFTLAHRLHI